MPRSGASNTFVFDRAPNKKKNSTQRRKGARVIGAEIRLPLNLKFLCVIVPYMGEVETDKGPMDLYPTERRRQDAEFWLSSEAGWRSDESTNAASAGRGGMRRPFGEWPSRRAGLPMTAIPGVSSEAGERSVETAGAAAFALSC